MAPNGDTASVDALNAIRVVALTFVSLLIAAGLAGAAVAAGPHGDGSGAAHGHGAEPNQYPSFALFEPAAAAEATRTVDVTMKDTAFEPQSIAIEAGETVRFVVKNEGELVHEFNVGTAAMHAEHQKQMAMMVDHGMLGADKINHDAMMGRGQMGGGQMMKHDDPNSVLLEPGQSGEVVLKFTNPTKLEFACNVPGHYEAGMVGAIDVSR